MRRSPILSWHALAPISILVVVSVVASSISCLRNDSETQSNVARAEELLDEAENLRLQYEKEAAREAIEKYRASLAAWEQAGDLDRAVHATRQIGKVYEQTGQLQAALESYEEGLELSSRARDPTWQGLLSADVGRVHILLGDPDSARQHCDRAVKLASQLKSRPTEGAALICLGELDYFLGHIDRAIESYGKALDLQRELGNVEGQAEALLFLGYSHSDRSEFDIASGFYHEALRLWRSLPDRRGEGLTHLALGRLQIRLGEYQKALNSLNQAMQFIEPIGDLVWLASVTAGLGTVNFQLGDNERAREYWSRSLDLFRSAGLQLAEVELLQSVGQTYLETDNPAAALTYFEQALSQTRELKNERWEATCLGYVAMAYQAMGELDEAIRFFKQSLELNRSIQDRRYEAYTVGRMGDAYLSLGETDLALECYHEALDLSRFTRDRVGESLGHYNLARVASRQQPDQALASLEKALALAESLRSDVESHRLRSTFLATMQQYYKLKIDLLMRLHGERPSEGLDAAAFETSERARARSLLESLTEAGVDVRSGVDPDLLARERQLRRALDAKADRQFNLSGESASEEKMVALAGEIRDLTDEFDRVQAEIRSRSPRYAALTQPQPLRMAAVQRDILDEDTLVLEYSLADDRSFLWTVEGDDYAAFDLPARDLIEELSLEVYGSLTARLPIVDESEEDHRARILDADSRYRNSAAELSEILLEPVADRLGKKRIVVISDGILQYLPFAALPIPSSKEEPMPLITRHEIVSLPSVSALGVLRSETEDRPLAPMAVAVLADPVFAIDDPRFDGGMRLAAADDPQRGVAAKGGGLAASQPWTLRALDVLGGTTQRIPRLAATRREAESIVAVAPAGQSFLAIGFAANRTAALNPDLRRYRVIHFATHGVLDNENPGLSGILLSMVDEQGRPQNGFLRLHDIYNLELPVELVVLSACNTALGKPVEGEGLVGLVRGFMYAGARRVVASLWKVDDQATGELMSRFYRQMFEHQRSPAAALRHAQLEMWLETEWNSPFYWAAFVLQGEWR